MVNLECKKMFLNTFCLGEKSVHSWLKKSPLDKAFNQNINEHINCIDELENINENLLDMNDTPPLPNTLPLAQKKAGVCQFLDSLPKMESHYCRARTSKSYLEPVWESKTQLYNEYKRICLEKKDEPASRVLFTKIFFSMNIGFFIPKKDQCETCIKFKLGKVTPENYESHQKRKVEARNEKENDKSRAEKSSEISVYAIDVQKVMTCPDIKASVAYYKTKLKIHNWSVFNLATHDGTCCIWHEGNGNLDSDVFASLLVRFLSKELEKKTRHHRNDYLERWLYLPKQMRNCG